MGTWLLLSRRPSGENWTIRASVLAFSNPAQLIFYLPFAISKREQNMHNFFISKLSINCMHQIGKIFHIYWDISEKLKKKIHIFKFPGAFSPLSVDFLKLKLENKYFQLVKIHKKLYLKIWLKKSKKKNRFFDH